MKVTFKPPTENEFEVVFLGDKGGGLGDIRIFNPDNISRGRRGGGIFSTLAGLAKKALPFIMRTVAPEAMEMGKGILSDVLEGGKLRDSVKRRGMQALKGVGHRVSRGGGVRKRGRVMNRKKKSTPKRKQRRKRVTGGCYKNDIFNSLGSF